MGGEIEHVADRQFDDVIVDLTFHENPDIGGLLLDVLDRVKEGDFSARMPLDWTGVPGKVADGLNDVIIANQSLERELARCPPMSAARCWISRTPPCEGSWAR